MRSLSNRPLRFVGCLISALGLFLITSCAAPEVKDAGLGPDPSLPLAVVVSPDSATIGVNEPLQLQTVGINGLGEIIAVESDWEATGGGVSATGVYTSAAAGRFVVRGFWRTNHALRDSSIVTVTSSAPTLTAVVVTPATASVAAGATRQFSAIGQLSNGSTTPVSVTWFATGGTITTNGLYTAGSTAGSFRVIATQQGGTLADTSSVTVTAPVLTQMTVSPSNTTIQTGGTQQFSVSGQLSDGSSTTPQVTYAATGGTITAGGLYSAGSTTGTFRVIATEQGGTLADTATVNITSPAATLQQIILTPATASLNSGAAQQFAVSGLMSDGSTIVPAVTYSATGGSITAGGRYTAAGTAGTFRVIATQQGGTLADTSTITITVPPPVLTQVILTPATASVQAGATQQFAVSGQMSDGSTTTPQVTYAATGGTITTGGLYTAGSTGGSFRVIATQQGGTLADTSTVTVTVPLVLTQVVLTPASVSLVAGATQQFSASGRMSDGSTTTVQVDYTATGGTITAGGLFSGGLTPGSFRVIATLQGGTLADTSTVTLTAPPVLTGVVLSPSTASVVTGATQQFTVAGQWSNGATTPPPVTWTATGGTISTGGVYTAGSTAGSFRVIATVTGGILADTANVTISEPPPPGTALFASDWAAGLLDGGKWTRWGGNGVLAAVPPTGLGFPTGMANVLRVGMGTGSFDWVEANNKWTLPAIGESRAFRLYLRNDVGAVNGGWSATHPVESKGTDGSISGSYYAWHIGSTTGSSFPIAFATAAGYPRNYYSTNNTTGSAVGTLEKGVTYRLEWKWTRTATNTYSLDMRITDPSGTVIEDNSTIKAWGGSTLASNNTGFPVDPAFMTGLRVGINGGFSASGTQNVYWGGFAVCADWCGAYSSF